MVKINFRFTSPGIKVLGLFLFPFLERLVEQSSDQTMGTLLRCPCSPRREPEISGRLCFFPPSLKEITAAGRCIPPEGEVGHLLKGGLERDSWEAWLLPLHLSSAPSRGWWGSGEAWKRPGLCLGVRRAPSQTALSLEVGCH